MDGSMWWLIGWGTVTVLAGIGCVLVEEPEARRDTALAYAGTAVLIVGISVLLRVLGWWPA